MTIPCHGTESVQQLTEKERLTSEVEALCRLTVYSPQLIIKVWRGANVGPGIGHRLRARHTVTYFSRDDHSFAICRRADPLSLHG